MDLSVLGGLPGRQLQIINLAFLRHQVFCEGAVELLGVRLKRLAQDPPVFFLSGNAVFASPQPQAYHECIIQVSNQQLCHALWCYH